MRERVFVEIIVEGAAQRDGGKAGGIEIVDAAALFAGGIARRLQVKPPWRVRQEILRESRCCRGALGLSDVDLGLFLRSTGQPRRRSSCRVPSISC